MAGRITRTARRLLMCRNNGKHRDNRLLLAGVAKAGSSGKDKNNWRQ